MEVDIHKALARMQENLAKLQSAREQVEQVSASGKELTEQTVALLAETSRLIEVLEINSRELSEQFAEKVTASEARIDRVVEERSALIGSTLDEMLQVVQKQKEQSDDLHTSIDGKLGQSLTDFKSELTRLEDSARKLVRESRADIQHQIEAFTVSAQEIKGSSASAVKDVSDLSVKVLNEQQREVRTLLTQLRETDEGVRSLLGTIRELDLGGKWLSLESEMKTFENEIKAFRQDMGQRLSAADARMETMQNRQTWLFYALGGIALLLLVLKFV